MVQICLECESEYDFHRKSHRSIGGFMGVILPITGPILEGPRGQNPYCCIADLVHTMLARDNLPFRPYLHACIPRITVVEQLPQENSKFAVPTGVLDPKLQTLSPFVSYFSVS